jgi:transposase
MNITDNELQKHYGLLMGIALPWQVADVKLELAEKRVKICLVWQEGQKAPCPVCGRECALYDLAPERTWRHLDTMQFETILRARTPRVECPTDGVKTIPVPWAEPGGRFSRLFERFAIDVLLCARSVKQAAGLMGLSWDEVDHILRRAVQRGLSRREMEGLSHVGIDEKSFRSGQSYISLLTDLASNWRCRRACSATTLTCRFISRRVCLRCFLESLARRACVIRRLNRFIALRNCSGGSIRCFKP